MSFQYNIDPDDIVTITMDMPGRPVNVINKDFFDSFQEIIKKLKNEKKLKGVILTSAKDTFLAGGDIEMLFELSESKEAFNMAEFGKKWMLEFETLGVPIVAALNGSALGAGMELALACHYRLSVNNPKVKFGFPEVTLGLLPGGGGITRLVRLLGLEKAMPFLLEGHQIGPDKAKRDGLIHDTAIDLEDLFKKSRQWIFNNPKSEQPWHKKGAKIPGGGPQHPSLVNKLIFAPILLQKKTWGNYPAAKAIMASAVEGSMVDFETASRIESRAFAEVVTGKECKNILKVAWFQLKEINQGLNRPKSIPPKEIKKVGVLGAGMMGHGITYASALNGIDTVMIDKNEEIAKKGYKKIEVILEQSFKNGKISEEKRKQILSKIKYGTDLSILKGCDLIIEAVFEDRTVKATMTNEAESYLDENGIFASNTSTLPITSLAKNSKRPDNFIGLHFFSPVHKMKLVEIIKGEKTTDQTLAKAFDFVIKIKKIPIVVNDSRAFYTSRVFGTYVHEGMALLNEGNDPQLIESAGKKAGMPVGPLALMDEVNLKLSQKIKIQTKKDLEEEGKEFKVNPGDDVLDFMIEKLKRTGKAEGAGFYEYPNEGKKYLWPRLREYFPMTSKPLNIDQMVERLMFIQVLETIRCYEEKVIRSQADANIGSLFGWGFAPFKGGTFQYIFDYGVKRFFDRAEEMVADYGDRFSPPDILKEMASKKE